MNTREIFLKTYFSGVVIDNKLNFEKHIVEKVNKANSIMGVI